MNRQGLVIALAVAVVVGVVFGVDARLDLDISALFFDPLTHMFRVNAQLWVQHAREAARWLIALIAAPAFLAIIGKLLWPHRRMLIEGRAALFLVATLALGPGIVTNTILKDHWGRSRPIDVTALGGTDRFVPWWDPRGDCPNNCSFIAGEPSGAFWTMAPAAFAPPQWRLLAYGCALFFGGAIGVLRVAGGGHFFTDVVFAGVFMYLIAWTLHGLIYRWRLTRLQKGAIERLLARTGTALYAGGGAKSRAPKGAFTPAALPELLASLPRAAEKED
ncbi:MAG TPA: phosphatase PAP2 family protein [Xanthobacteraceae bacterium]|jgi:membrane-associated PAP2 superfamily phosphatase